MAISHDIHSWFVKARKFDLHWSLGTFEFFLMKMHSITVADPGFPRRAPASKVGGQPIILPNFYRKLHENERIWTQRGGGTSLNST